MYFKFSLFIDDFIDTKFRPVIIYNTFFQHAYALTFLTDQLFDGAKALDVGSGSGYLTACMAHMVGPRGCVIGIEHIPELVEASIQNVTEDNHHFIEDGRVKFLGKISCYQIQEHINHNKTFHLLYLHQHVFL